VGRVPNVVAGLGAVVLLAALAVVGRLPAGSLRWLVTGLALVPLAVVLAARGERERRLAGGLAAVAGVAAVVEGYTRTRSTDALDLLRLDFTGRQILLGAATWLAPVGLLLLGLVLLPAAVAALGGDRPLARTAGGLGVLLHTVTAVALVGLALQPLGYRGGVVGLPALAAAAVVVVAGLLTALLVVWPWPPAEAPRPRNRALAAAALGTVLAVLAGVGAWTGREVADKQDLAALFPDQALQACLSAQVRPEPTRRELTGVVALKCNGDTSGHGRIISLQGLDQLPSLTSLELPQNAVTDLTPVARVPALTHLVLTNNAITDVSPLTGLTDLQELGLSNNRITDLGPLASLRNVRFVGLAGNQVRTLEPLADLTAVTEFDASDNLIVDVAPLAGMTALTRLSLAYNKITDVAPLENLPALAHVTLTQNRIRDAKPLTRLRAAEELTIGGNAFTDVGPLTALPELQGVDLEGSDPTRVRGVEKLRKEGVFVGGLA
jgi:internalin A